MSAIGNASEFRSTLLSAAWHKPGQGRWARGLTFGAIAAIALYGGFEWWKYFSAAGSVNRIVFPLVVVAAVLWIAYRLVNYPRFADFLITTEAEMNKVSWPSWRDVKTATFVVLALAGLLAAFLFGVDWMWQKFLVLIRVLQYAGIVQGDNS